MKLSAITDELRKLAALPHGTVSRVNLGGTSYTIHGGDSKSKFNPPKKETPNRMEYNIEADRAVAVSLYGGTEHNALDTLRAQIDRLGGDMDAAARKRAQRLISLLETGHVITKEYPYITQWERRKLVRVYDTSAEPTLRIHGNDVTAFNKTLGRERGTTVTPEELTKLQQTFIIQTI